MKNFLKRLETVGRFDILIRVLIVVVIGSATIFSSVRAFQIGKGLAESGAIGLAIGGVIVGLSICFFGFLVNRYYRIKSDKLGKRQTRRTIGLRQLNRLCDLIPTPRLRKRIKKLLADQEDHIAQLKRSMRLWAARWIVLTTWILVAWYVLVSPVTAFTQAIAGVFKGAGD